MDKNFYRLLNNITRHADELDYEIEKLLSWPTKDLKGRLAMVVIKQQKIFYNNLKRMINESKLMFIVWDFIKRNTLLFC